MAQDRPAGGDQRRALAIALVLNAIMFVVDLLGGILGESSGLIADSLDMLADAAAYGISLAAIHRAPAFKARAAGFSGILLLVLGAGVVLDAVRRFLTGSDPLGPVMIGVAALALIVNVIVLRLLSRHRGGGVHLHAAWIFTRADVLANLGVILGGFLVMLLRSPLPDLLAGVAIGLFITREATKILARARRAASG